MSLGRIATLQLRQRIVALAQRHRRYGVGMIHLKLRQAGQLVNYKRVERLYRLEKLQIRRRRRKKIPVARAPAADPPGRSQRGLVDGLRVRSGRLGRTIKSLVIVDDATHECVAIVAEHSIGGTHLTRILDEVCCTARQASRDPLGQRPGVHRQSDADLGAPHGVSLRLIEPGKPNQNAYVEIVQRTTPR